MIREIAITVLIAAIASPASSQQGFRYKAPGILASGVGRTGDRRIYFPDFSFPLQAGQKFGDAHAYLNSQVYSTAGGDAALNYAYPWEDTYCEKRAWDMPLCPGKQGHQGVDIRPHGNNKSVDYPVLSVADGIVTAVTPFTRVEVRYRDDIGPYSCRYLHLSKASSASLKIGQAVKRGDKLGSVSNIMGGKPNTTWHLHFDCKRNIDGVAIRPPIYTSLVASYRRSWELTDLVVNGKLGVDAIREIGGELANSEPETGASRPKTWTTRNYGAITPQTEPESWPPYIRTWPGLDASTNVRDNFGKIIPALKSDESGIGLWWYWLNVRAGFSSGTLTFRELATKYSGAKSSSDPSVNNYLNNYVGDGASNAGLAKLYFPKSPKADDPLKIDDAATRWSIAQTVFHFEAGKPPPFGKTVFEKGIALGNDIITPQQSVSTESQMPKVATDQAAACDATSVEVVKQSVSLKITGCLKQEFILGFLRTE